MLIVSAMRRVFVPTCIACILVIPQAAAQTQPETLEVNGIQLAAAGWTEEAPGVWTRVGDHGEQRLKAQGPEALSHVLEGLKERAQNLLEGNLGVSNRASRLSKTLALIARIEADLQRPVAPRRPPCSRTGSVLLYANPGPACGVSAYARSSVTSNSYCSTDCLVYSATYAEGACSSGGSTAWAADECEINGQTEVCSSYSRKDRPFDCEALAGAYLYCASEYFLEMADYDETFTCGGSGYCDC